MFINTIGMITGVNTVDVRKTTCLEVEEVIEGLRVFPKNTSMTQGFHVDLGSDEDRILMTVAGDRIMIVHACLGVCLALVDQLDGNIISVNMSGGDNYTLWMAPYDEDAYEQAASYLVEHPHNFDEASEWIIGPANLTEEPEALAEESAPRKHRKMQVPPSYAFAADGDEYDAEDADYDEFDEEDDYDDRPSLWQRFKDWILHVLCLDEDDEDYEDDYDDED